jgi:hypothetical protein
MSVHKNFRFPQARMSDLLAKLHPFLEQHGIQVGLDVLQEDPELLEIVEAEIPNVESFYSKPSPAKNKAHHYIVNTKINSLINDPDGPYHLLSALIMLQIVMRTVADPKNMEKLHTLPPGYREKMTSDRKH